MNDAFMTPVQIAKMICTFEGDTAFAHMGRVMVAVGQAVTDVYENAIPHVRSVFVQIQNNMTVAIPEGSSRILKVGALNDHAQIIHLYEDNRLRRSRFNEILEKSDTCDFEAGIIIKPPPKEYTRGSDYFHGCADNVGAYGELYGYRFDPAVIGTWRQNIVDGVIEFGSGPFVQPGRWVIVEFKDMGSGRFATIPSNATPAIITRARWWLSGGGSRGAAHMADFKREYFQYRREILRKDILDYLRGIGSDQAEPFLPITPSIIATVDQMEICDSTTSTGTGGSGSGGNIPLQYFNDDAHAMANGLQPGDEYLLTDANSNNYSLPGGLPKIVYAGP